MSVAKVKRYAAYKDSGVEWLGEVPEHWNTKRVKELVLSFEQGWSPNAADWQAEEGGFGVLKLSAISNGLFHELNNKSLDLDKLPQNTLLTKKGSVLITRSNTPLLVADSCFVRKTPYASLVVPDLVFCLTFNLNFVEPEFITYALNCSSFRWVKTISARGLNDSMVKVSQGIVRNWTLFIPPVPEQTAITAYLNSKTAQIDRKIDLLSQKAMQYGKLKQSLINETVTRGLDKTVPIKESGVRWIGEVPEGWEIQRIGTAFEERSEKVNDTDYPPLSVSMAGIVPQMISVAKTDNNDNRKRVAIGDYVINSRSDRRGASGISIYDGSVSVICIVLAPKRAFFGKYLHHLFRSYRFIEEFYRVGRGIVDDLWTTRYSVMKGIEFSYPSYDEQKLIADYLDKKTAQIDRIVTNINNQIDKLKKLRKTLINDVVTGKIKVIREEQTV